MHRILTINFIGNFGVSGTGEMSDEVHLSRELKRFGHKVNKIPRDVWKAHCDGHQANDDWVLPTKADINILCKWQGFDNAKYVYMLRSLSNAPVFYWTWDYFGWINVPDWHKKICLESDLHLTNELGDFKKIIGKPYYFPMDVCDGDYSIFQSKDKLYDVTFFGSYFENGGRLDLMKAVNDKHNLTIFSPNHKQWTNAGFNALPAVWGNDLNRIISQSKICLQVSVSNECAGYWSNRVGKILYAGGFMLARYVKGMEQIIGDAADYFSSNSEALDKIQYYLDNPQEIKEKQIKAKSIGWKFTSETRVKELTILIERYLNNGI